MSVYVVRLLFFLFFLLGCHLNLVLAGRVIPVQLPVTTGTGQNALTEDLVPVPWLSTEVRLGQVTGVSLDPDDNIYLFHRAERIWDEHSFDDHDVYALQHLGPIIHGTILVFNSNGTLLNQLGHNLFFLPHGITVDNEYNVWVTDVALHQVMKLSPRSNDTALVLGEKFVPGKDAKHFCKPTSVAVLANGDFFVADGYCNSRIIKFNSDGKKILEWGRETSFIHPPGNYELNVPHALTLVEDKGLVCTADRENGRVVCYRVDNGEYVMQMSSNVMGPHIYSVAYSNGKFYTVNGKDRNVPAKGFILNMSGNIVGQFGNNLKTPHDIAVSSTGSSVYVVEINPYKAWKFAFRPRPINQTEKVKEIPKEKVSYKQIQKEEKSVFPKEEEMPSDKIIYNKSSVDNVEGLTGAVLVTFGCFVFAVGLFMAVLIYSKSRKPSSSDTRRLLSNIDY